MFTSCAGVEVLIRITSKIAQAFHFILYCMRMNDVHNHCNTQSVCGIDQLLQFFRSTETGRSGKETGYMVTETTVVGMFLNCHDLNAIVSGFSYARKSFFTELVVSSYFIFLLRHTNMAFVDKQRIRIRFKCTLLYFIWLFRCPDLRTENLGLLILYHPCYPGRNTFSTTAFPMYNEFV